MKKLAFGLMAASLMFALLPATAMSSTVFGGSYKVVFFREPGLAAGGTQCIVAIKTGSEVSEPGSGTWSSPTFPGWKGEWIQRGDSVRWYGQTGALSTEETQNYINPSSLAGSFVHFGLTSGAGQTASGGYTTMTKVTSCAGLADETSAPADNADPAQ